MSDSTNPVHADPPRPKGGAIHENPSMPLELRTLLGAEDRAAHREALSQSVLTDAAEAEEAAHEAVRGHHHYRLAVRQGEVVLDAERAFAKKEQAIREKHSIGGSLTDAGREALAEAAAKRDKAIMAAEATADEALVRVLADAPSPHTPDNDPGVWAEITAINSGFQLRDPAEFLAYATNELDGAVNSSDPQVRIRKSAILAEGILPLLRRRASAPERFAKRLAGEYAELAGLVEHHVRTVRGAAKRSSATERARAVKSQLASLRKNLADGMDPGHARLANPVLFEGEDS